MTKFFFPQQLNVVDAFEEFEGSEEEKNAVLGYITRAKMSDKAFSSLGGYYVVPDEENKKLKQLEKEKRRSSFVTAAPILLLSTTLITSTLMK